MQVNNQQLEPDMGQQTGSKLGKECLKAVCCHPAYSPYMQSTSQEILGWMKHKLKSKIAGKNINNLRYVDGTTLMPEIEKKRKSLLIKLKAESENLSRNSV